MANKKLIAAPLFPVDLPQCEAMRASSYASDHAKTDRQCTHGARYSILGKNLCTKHAGSAALQIFLTAEKDRQGQKP